MEAAMAKVAILTTFQEFDPWYSLTGIVKDQVQMLTEYGNEVFLIVNEKFNQKNISLFSKFKNITILEKTPFAHLHDYQKDEPLKPEHEKTVNDTTKMLTDIISEHGIDTFFTHDIVFTGWNKPYALGIQALKDKTPGIAWLHWIHSIPSQFNDWWYMANYGANHKLIYPNRTDIIRVAENYRTSTGSVRVIPHIKDIRIMFDFNDNTCAIIDAFPALIQADIVQIYPASSDRFEAKNVDKVMKIMAYIKSLGHTVCLFIANQWATTQKHYANIDEYYKLGMKYGLTPKKDLIFSSSILDINNECMYKKGLPSKILFQLMQLSNLFVFPTTHETFGLVLPEVSLASGALCVLNRSLTMQKEIAGSNTIFFDFGSYTHGMNKTDEEWDYYLSQVAIIILGRMQENDSILTRTFMRKQYNYDNLYAKYYAPVMAELRISHE